MRQFAYRLFHSTGLTHAYNNLKGRKRGVISYHNVLPDAGFSLSGRYYTDISRTVMEYQLQFLQKRFQILPFTTDEFSSDTGFLLSFDDGMLNNYEIVLPLLRKYNIKAMFAVCPAMVEGTVPHIWRDHIHLLLLRKLEKTVLLPIDDYQTPFKVTQADLSILENRFRDWIYQNRIANIYEVLQEFCRRNNLDYKREGYDPLRFQFMNWDQIRHLQQEGHVIASHTCTHRIMRFLSEEEKQTELSESRRILEDKLQASVQTIVYPYGGESEIDERTIQIAEACGYTQGYLNVKKSFLPHSLLAISRFSLPFTQEESFLFAVTSGLHDNLKQMLS